MYPHLSARVARAFARAVQILRECSHDSGPRERILAERYRKASEYLYSRISRPVEGGLQRPVVEVW